ncbi:unnamed protein product, partial [Musa acuminata subsp. burmannicoides]
MPNNLLAKDLILQIIGEITVAGAKSMEFVGSTVKGLSASTMMTLCNMVIEAGGKNGVVSADETTFKCLEDKTSKNFEPLFIQEYKIDVSKLEPLVAKPHFPDSRALARECKGIKIDRAYIGSCTGGKMEDFLAAAKVFLASVRVPTFLVPATQKVQIGACMYQSGRKTCSQIFEEAGCEVPCLFVSTTNRNFHGRMGHKEGQMYLASPYTAAASAFTGYVTDPRDFLP